MNQAHGFTGQRNRQRVGYCGCGGFHNPTERIYGYIAALLCRKPGHKGRVVNSVTGIHAVIAHNGSVVAPRNGNHGKTVYFTARAVGEVDGN